MYVKCRAICLIQTVTFTGTLAQLNTNTSSTCSSHMLIQTYLDRLSPTWIIKGEWRVTFCSQSTRSLRGGGIDFKTL